MNGRMKNQKGFTLVETLAVVGIIIVLSLISMMGVSAIVQNLRQKEMDSKAETIYLAVQHRLTSLSAAGCQSVYQDKTKLTRLEFTPMDAENTETELYYFTSEKKEQEPVLQLLPKDSVDTALWENHWIAEIDPAAGSVYAVYYSEEDILGSLTDAERDSLRSYEHRKRSKNGKIGYYGGDMTVTVHTEELKPTLQILNGEQLILRMTCISPDSSPLQFRVKVTDSAGKSVEKTFKPTFKGRNTYTHDWVIDDLSDPAKRFDAVTEKKLSCGTEITIDFTADSRSSLLDPKTVTGRTNSLFGYDPSRPAGTAVITCGRHLQNLDRASGVTGITDALQISDISFADDPLKEDDWYTVYNNRPFDPIDNPALKSYTGSFAGEGGRQDTEIRYLQVKNVETAGLFKTLYAGSYENIRLSAPHIRGTKLAGGLAGSTSGAVTIRQCRVYFSEKSMLDGKTEKDIWIAGDIAGGLIGAADLNGQLTMEDSFAATVLEGQTRAGGLVGHAGSVSFIRSYADCYLTAENTAGLAVMQDGKKASLASCYAAGYQWPQETAAGLINGGVSQMTQSYSACVYPELVETATVYTTAASADHQSNIYYLNMAGGDNYQHLDQTAGKIYTDLHNLAVMKPLLGSDFTGDLAGLGSNAYNLMNQGLIDYSYLRLNSLPHFGDWQAEFETGLPVYYEVYDDRSCGFAGANKDNLISENPEGGKQVTGDGYGVVYDTEQTAVSIEYDGTTYKLADVLKTQIDGITYYIYPFPKEIVNTKNASADYYQKITLTDGKQYYFNPHFANTLVSYSEKLPKVPKEIEIRTPRQLYNLSLYYDAYRDATAESTFYQFLHLQYKKYKWADYTLIPETALTEGTPLQKPIGTDSESGFSAGFNGAGRMITGAGFQSDGSYIGLFGCISPAGKVSNVVLAADYFPDSRRGGILAHEGAIQGRNKVVYMGALAGMNRGVVTNCAVTGYTTKLDTYNGSRVYWGGFVGTNFGIIQSSSAVIPHTRLNVNHSTAYAAGFAGKNQSLIVSCYSIGAIDASASKGSSADISGFAGNNAGGSVHACYSAVALVASGETESHGFAPIGGAVSKDCCYINNGAYYFTGALYAFNSYERGTGGTGVSGRNLSQRSLFGSGKASVQNSLLHPHTAEERFPYPAVVRNADGEYVHYGDWTVLASLGETGIYYWEKEEEGSNNGWHFSYIGVSGRECFTGSSLCTAHDDGGVITSYGYGYYYQERLDKTIQLAEGNILLSARNEQAEKALGRQVPGYRFVAYTTSDSKNRGTTEEVGLQISGSAVNADWELIQTKGGKEYRHAFVVSPFFADAMQYRGVNVNGKLSAPVKQPGKYQHQPGSKENPYSVRSIQQLQLINWNYQTKNAHTIINRDTVQMGKQTSDDKYTYLYYESPDQPDQKPSGNRPSLFWEQHHDIHAKGDPDLSETYFTPIGCLYDVGREAESSATIAYFTGSYTGNDYTIRNLEIHSTAQCVGLFGFTTGAKLQNIALYSDRDNQIKIEGGENWYCLGGLVGFAADGGKQAVLKNCTVSGYQIISHRKNHGDWGGANIGGLAGAANMPVSGCTAVNDISLEPGYHTGYNNIRAGGLIGGFRRSVENCYVGGSIQNKHWISGQDTGNVGWSTNIWIGGITGGIVMRNSGNLKNLVGNVEGAVSVKNCYSYLELPGEGNFVRNVNPLASNGEMQNSGFVNYTQNEFIRIENCYCISDKGWNNSDNGKDIVMDGYVSGGYDRRILLKNPRSPYLDYADMKKPEFAEWLNHQQKSEPFGWVTTEENGAKIPGKYSFPGNDPELAGLDYPFPTVLTQKDNFGGRKTVNVHYGRWPKVGLFWEKAELELDLISDYDEKAGKACLPVQLAVRGIDSSKLNPAAFQISYPDGEKEAGLSLESYDPKTGILQALVTGKEVGSNTARISITQNNISYQADLHVRVTAELILTADPESVRQFRGEEQQVQFTARIKDGREITADCHWKYTVDDEDIAEAAEAAHKGAVLVHGYSAGDTLLHAAASYTLGGRTFTEEGLVSVTTLPAILGMYARDVLYEVSLDDEKNIYQPSYPKNGPELSGYQQFLYTNLDIRQEDVTSVLIDGTEAYQTKHPGYTLRFGKVRQDENFSYLPLVILAENGEEREFELTVKLFYRGKHIVFHVPGKTQGNYIVSFDPAGGQLNGSSDRISISVKPGASVIFPEKPERFGYWFRGWGLDENLYQPGDSCVPEENLIFRAKWERLCVITLDLAGGHFEDPSAPTVFYCKSGETFQIPDRKPILEGHKFLGWTAGWDFTDMITEIPVSGDITVTAQWKKMYQITFDLKGGSYSGPTVLYCDLGTSFNLPSEIPVKQGHRFAGWMKDKYTYSPGATFIANSDMNFTAVWEEGCFITYHANGGTPDKEIKRFVKQGVRIPLSESKFEKEGYGFLGWTRHPNPQPGDQVYRAVSWFTVLEDTDFYAQWGKNCTVTLYPNGGKYQNSSEAVIISAAERGSFTPEKPERPGYEFVGWTAEQFPAEGETIYQAGEEIPVAGDMALYAQWKETTEVKLTLNIGHFNTITIDGKLYEANRKGKVTVPVKLDEKGCFTLPAAYSWWNQFEKWEDDEGNDYKADTDKIPYKPGMELNAEWIR